MNAPGLSVVAIGSPVALRATLFTLGMTDASIVLLLLTHKVRVIRFHESPSSSRLVLLHLLLGVASHLLMRLDVARNTQRLQVVATHVVCKVFHLLLSLGRLDGRFVMNIHSRRDVTIGQHARRNPIASAPLA